MKIAFSGSHGTGKSTSVFQLAHEMKLFHKDKKVGVLHENAAESPFPINKKTTKESQMWIFSNQMQKELYLSTKYDILITDRSVVDAIGYTLAAEFNDLAETFKLMAKQFIHTYDEIYFKLIENNDYLVDDGLRDASDRDFRKKVEDNILKVYEEILPKDFKIYYQ